MVGADSRAGARVQVFHPQTAAPVDVVGNVTTHHRPTTREQRWGLLGARGGTVWFTGLPGAGKTTIASALELRLLERGPQRLPARRRQPAPGDLLRPRVHPRRSRPQRQARRRARPAARRRRHGRRGGARLALRGDPPGGPRGHLADGLLFLEVFVNTPLDVCAERDPKGMYAQANAGQLDHFTGIDDPYEPPSSPGHRAVAGAERRRGGRHGHGGASGRD